MSVGDKRFSVATILFLISMSAMADVNNCAKFWEGFGNPSVELSVAKRLQPETVQPSVKSIDHYLQKVEQRNSKKVQPRFVNPTEELALERSWKSEAAPTIVQEALPKGVGAINHALYQSQPGVVKIDGTGLMVSVRAELDYKGRMIGTNAAVSSNALFSNLGQQHKYLARKDAKAVVIFLHGGGTKSTGHHVAANIMNYMGSYAVDVISIDQPWHGEGPRVFFKNADEYFDYLLDFIETFVPPGVPVVLSGHSMGGTYADMILRRSDKNPKIKKLIAGIAALSNVADLVPGGTFAEKLKADQLRESDGTVKAQMSEEDSHMMESLVEKAKVSPLSLFDIQNIMMDNDWSFPTDAGAKYLPSIHIIGDRDFLYAGLADHYKKYVGGLQNGELVVYPNVGHIIFSDDATFDHIRNFISRLTGKTLEKLKNVRGNAKTGMLQRIIETYLNNLAFREFVKEYQVKKKVGQAKVNEMKNRLVLLNEYNSKVGDLKKKNKTITNAEIDAQVSRPLNTDRTSLSDTDIRTEIAKLESLFRSNFVPQGALKDFAIANIARREQIEQEASALQKERAVLKEQVDKLSVAKKRFDKQLVKHYDVIFKKFLGRTLTDEESALYNTLQVSPEISHALIRSVSALKDLTTLYNTLYRSNSDYVRMLVETGRRNEQGMLDMPVELVNMYRLYQIKEKQYQDLVKKSSDIFYSHAAKGEVSPESLDLSQKIQETTKDLEGKARKLTDTDLKLINLQEDRGNLLANYMSNVSPDMFTFETNSLAALLNMSSSGIEEWLGSIESAWKVWTALWREKPQSEGSGLY